MTRKSKEERLRYIYAKRKERAEQAKLEHSTKVGHLMYNKYVESNDQPAILLNGLFVEPRFQRRGIGTSILRRLRKDNPHALVNPGPRSNDGEALFKQIAKNPEWAGSVIRTPQDLKSNLRGEYKLPSKAWRKAKT